MRKLLALSLFCCSIAFAVGGCGDSENPVDVLPEATLDAKPQSFDNTSLPKAVEETIDFEGLPAGTIVSNVTASGGSVVDVMATNPNFAAGTNAAVIFDSANPTGQDPDLGTPNQNFGGPGVGSAGVGGPFVNNTALGNLLIVAEDLVNNNGDDLVDDPDDVDAVGSMINFGFTGVGVGTVSVSSITLIDVESDEPEAIVEFFDAAMVSLGSVSLPIVGDNGVAVVALDSGPGVAFMDVVLNGSGAIDNIVFTPDEPGVITIGDYVWCDQNDDGVQDGNEPGIAGVEVTLNCAGDDGALGTADDLTRTTTTDANGGYLFSDVPVDAQPCVVSVSETAVDGKVPGNNCPTSIDVPELVGGESYLDADFCFFAPPVSIGDYVWCDENNDGVQDDTEPGIAGVEVTLTCAGADGDFGTADVFTDATTTDADGNYLFTGVPSNEACQVSVSETAVDGKVPGDNCPITVDVPALDPGAEFLDADFCFVEQPTSIGDYVWCDENNDGVQDDTEPGIAGVEVTLTCAGADGVLGTADDEVLTQSTDADGGYLFTDLPAGFQPCSVSVSETAVDGKVPGDNCPVSIDVPTLAPGESYLDADFCFYAPPGSVGDFVWCDENNDGVQDAGEPGIEGAKVTIVCAGIDGVFGTADDFSDMQLTDANGGYLFTGVPSGEACRVTVDETTVADKVPGDFCPTQVDVPALDPGGEYLDADFCFYTPEECEECDGKVTELTLEYLGDSTAQIRVEQKKDDKVVFDGMVGPGEQFSFVGEDKHNTLSTEIRIYVDGVLNTKIHTSCSQPIGPGLVSGDFEVITGQSRNGGLLCPVDNPGPDPDPDCECDGKVTELTLEYLGDSAAQIRVEQKKDDVVVFDANVAPGEQFSFVGQDDRGTLSTEIKIFVDGVLNTSIHTSCSQPIGPGLVSGDFLVIAGSSRNGGELCPLDDPGPDPDPDPDPDCECDGKVTELTLEYLGSSSAQIRVEQKKDDVVVFDAVVAPGEQFSFVGEDKKNTLGTEIKIFVDGVLNTKIHTSCSQPIGPGLISGDFLVIEGMSRNGGELCPL